MARTTITMALILLSIIQATMSTISPNVNTFFPDIKGNLTKITWAHAVNSQALLDVALDSDVMMLEADVVLGTLNTTSSTQKIPIMAHPPANESDLSLEEFLNASLTDGKRGIKLDFKTIEVFEQSKGILAKIHDNVTFPLWLNADILPGPVNATRTPVHAKSFLAGAFEVFPESTLSIGWTTRYGSAENINNGSYTADQIQEMIDTLAECNVTQSVTYPVRAGLVANDVSVIKTLLANSSANNSTLTIWSSANDYVDTKKLSTLIKTIGVDRVYIDVPEELWKDLDISSDASALRTGLIMIFGVAFMNLMKIL